MAAFAALALATAFSAAHAIAGFGGPGLAGFANEWIYTGIELLAVGLCFARALRRAEDRTAWLRVPV